jgi:chromosome segregation ATPase
MSPASSRVDSKERREIIDELAGVVAFEVTKIKYRLTLTVDYLA